MCYLHVMFDNRRACIALCCRATASSENFDCIAIKAMHVGYSIVRLLKNDLKFNAR